MERMAEPRAGQRVPRSTDGNGIGHRPGKLERGPVDRLDRLECTDCAVGVVFAKGHLDLTGSGVPIVMTVLPSARPIRA
jgi:hypothetical protein